MVPLSVPIPKLNGRVHMGYSAYHQASGTLDSFMDHLRPAKESRFEARGHAKTWWSV